MKNINVTKKDAIARLIKAKDELNAAAEAAKKFKICCRHDYGLQMHMKQKDLVCLEIYEVIYPDIEKEKIIFSEKPFLGQKAQ